MSTQNDPQQGGNIEEFKISSNFGDYAVDLSGGVVEFRYYESVLSNTITATATVMETGFQLGPQGDVENKQSTIDGLPIRGGERTDIIMEDNEGNKLEFEEGLYVNRLRDVNPGTQKDLYFIDFGSKEFFANEQTRVVQRYEGSISQNVEKIVKDVLQSEIKSENIHDTAEPYNFIGNSKKPFYIMSWLASKAIPQVEEDGGGGNATGGAAGYFFYQTRDGFNFKSIDKIFAEVSNYDGKKYIYNNTPGLPETHDVKVLAVDINSDIDLHDKLVSGSYKNHSIFFDFLSYDYKSYIFPGGKGEKNLTEEQYDKKTVAAGDEKLQNLIPKEFTQSPTRLMTHVLDYGIMPSGLSSDEQLEKWKNDKTESNYKAEETMVQSIMRYNQLFTVKTNITIPGDFSIKAGDLISCDFPELKGDPSEETNPETGGIYMVANVCHKVTPGSTLTSLDLVRDSFGKKPTGKSAL